MNPQNRRNLFTLAATILLAACALGSAGEAAKARLRPAVPQETDAGRPVQRIRITAERFSFAPSRIKVKTGTIVEIVGESEDTSHGFHLADAGIDTEIPARGKGELRLRFEAAEAGTYFFECSRPCGAGHNTMRGTIVVED
jgi:cytochrome c oxidase subunit 2